MKVFGTVNIANFTKTPDPTWQCSLDGIDIEPNPFQFPENNWELCSVDSIPDGSHELVVNITSNGMPFYLDYLEYRASATISLENSLILIDNNDPAIDYISGWDPLGSTANQTTDPDGLVKVTFVGTQLSWYGFIPTEESHHASSGAYSIDGGPLATFQLHGLSSSITDTRYNQLFFTTPMLEMGTHVLSVNYTGQTDQTPLTLYYLIVANGSFASPPFSTGGDTNETGSRTQVSDPTTSSNGVLSGSTRTSPSHVGAVVGGVVGSLIAVIIMIIFFIWFKSHRRRRQGHPTNGIIPSRTQRQRPPILLPLPLPPPLSPLETSYDPPQNRIRYASQLTEMTSAESYSSYSTTTNTTSFHAATNRVSAQPTIASIASTIIRTAIRRPLPVAPALVVSKKPMGQIITPDVVQHKDSRIRLPTLSRMRPGQATGSEEFIPRRNYVIMNDSDSFT
ncbi:hypothetical protein Clacol_010217 [Clathrus columnatus]|uniref:Uncharacterized protein n=1 Tax=Clathrus columnatus TaxID=1419009 RepID=A0AAV5ASF8_9AGAM|nr:hypothetical protein Clacol_010217 [Clathrus columnatus]